MTQLWVAATIKRDFLLVLDLQRSISCFDVGWNLLENQNILPMLLQTHSVSFYVLQATNKNRQEGICS